MKYHQTSYLAAGNRAFREGQFDIAIRSYVKAVKALPALEGIIGLNINMASRRYRAWRQESQRLKVAVCGWEFSHNAAGRVYSLAKMYESFADVTMVGTVFPGYGNGIWEPLQGTNIPIDSFQVDEGAEFLDKAVELVLAHPCDLVHLSKPRAPNILIGILFRLLWEARVILDIDDDEIAFVDPNETTDSRPNDSLPPLTHLDGTTWTRLAAAMVGLFDDVTVPNPALQKRFGGHVIRHARDGSGALEASKHRGVIRKKLGISAQDKVVLFFGTPRQHKGLIETANALQKLRRDDVLFCVIGLPREEELMSRLKEIKGVRFKFLPNQPIEKAHEFAVVGDICVLLQDSESRAAKMQTPAKLSDALAAGLVVLASDTPGLMDVHASGAVIKVGRETLAMELERVLNDSVHAQKTATLGRELFHSTFSYAANMPTLRALARHTTAAETASVEKRLSACPLTALMPLAQLLLSEKSQFENREKKDYPPAVPAVRSTPQPNAAKMEATTTVQRKLPLTALVITWDVGHNPLGRSYMLAETLDRVIRNVVIAGFQFPRYGDDIWEPVRNSKLPVIGLPGKNFPEFLDSVNELAQRIKPDVVIACKPRLPSVLLGLKLKANWNCPLIIDVDDHELSFFNNRTPIDLQEFESYLAGSNTAALAEPYSELWTRLTQSLCKLGDEIIVSNIALHREFGGTIVPHVRDEKVFDPALHDRLVSRQRYGVSPQAKVVLFFGTPRIHKGIDTLARAVGGMVDENYRLVVVGTSTDRSVTAKLDSMAPGRIIYLPNQAFSDIPSIMAMADVVCLPQDEKHPISQYQLPAKAIDAVGMGIPLLTTRTPPLMQLIQDGVAIGVDGDEVAAAIERLLSAPQNTAKWKEQTRDKFLGRYSYAAAAQQLRDLVQRAVGRRNRPSIQSEVQRLEKLIIKASGNYKQESKSATGQSGTDIVLFWKQNDTCIYGRRHDMVIKYLASRDDVRKVVVFDAPLSEFDLIKRREATNGLTQDRFVYTRAYEKALGKLNTEKIKYNVFIHPPGKYSDVSRDEVVGRMFGDYATYVNEVLQRECVEPSRAVFWLYPKNDFGPRLVEHFKPAKTVVDVVDDHRAWPGISDDEKNRLTQHYRETLTLADMAFVNCEPVRESMNGFHPNIRVVPNGCDLNPPAIQPNGCTDFEQFRAWKGKTIGFVGNLEAKIDVSLLEKVAQRYSDSQLVLLGSTHANPAVKRLANLSNVRMPGVVPYEQIGAWLSKFDVALIPHLDMEMTRSMNPLKLYVYLVAGVPVVSTDVFNVATDSSAVRVAKSHDDFLDKIGECLQSGRLGDADVKNYVAANSWAARFKIHIDELLDLP